MFTWVRKIAKIFFYIVVRSNLLILLFSNLGIYSSEFIKVRQCPFWDLRLILDEWLGREPSYLSPWLMVTPGWVLDFLDSCNCYHTREVWLSHSIWTHIYTLLRDRVSQNLRKIKKAPKHRETLSNFAAREASPEVKEGWWRQRWPLIHESSSPAVSTAHTESHKWSKPTRQTYL